MSDTRESILRTAARMLQLKGYNAFSFAHVAEVLDVKPAAIHYHFPTKTELGVALLQRYHLRYRQLIEDAEVMPVVDQLNGFFSIFERFAQDGRVCFEGVLEAEWNAVPKEMQQELFGIVEDVQGWLVPLIERGRKEGAFRFEGAARDKATQISATLQGALQIARLRGKSVFDASMRQMRRELGL